MDYRIHLRYLSSLLGHELCPSRKVCGELLSQSCVGILFPITYASVAFSGDVAISVPSTNRRTVLVRSDCYISLILIVTTVLSMQCVVTGVRRCMLARVYRVLVQRFAILTSFPLPRPCCRLTHDLLLTIPCHSILPFRRLNLNHWRWRASIYCQAELLNAVCRKPRW